MRRIKAAPGARRLVGSLRNMGYDCATAIADLVDNSIAARATEVHVQVLAQHGSRPPAVVISDNGAGMNQEMLWEAMRFGAYQEYSADDLGKYGLGLKTASLSQCRVLTVASKVRSQESRRHYARWSLEELDSTDDWDLLLPRAEELEAWELRELDHEASRDGGTTVLWTGLGDALPHLSSHDLREREGFLAALVAEVRAHLRMVFHRFMEDDLPGRPRTRFFVCGEELTPWDPFCRAERTRELATLRIPLKVAVQAGEEICETVTVCPFVLPREDEFSSPAVWREASGPQNWNQQQGLYFYRNNRLLQAGGWSYLRAIDEHLKLLRVAVHFPQALDQAFEINITKMRARVPAGARDTVRQAISVWAREARERYDRAPGGSSGRRGLAKSIDQGVKAKRSNDSPPTVRYGGLSFVLSNAPGHCLTVSRGPGQDQVRIVVPHSHDAAGLFAGGDDLRKLALAAVSVLEALYEGRLDTDGIPLEPLRRALQRLKA